MHINITIQINRTVFNLSISW